MPHCGASMPRAPAATKSRLIRAMTRMAVGRSARMIDGARSGNDGQPRPARSSRFGLMARVAITFLKSPQGVVLALKSEIRISKSETNSKSEIRMHQTNPTSLALPQDGAENVHQLGAFLYQPLPLPLQGGV